MSEAPVALSPIQPVPPTEIRDGWKVSTVHSHAALRLADRTPLTKVLVRASPHGGVASRLGVPFGRARRTDHGVLVIGSGPDEWLLLGPPRTFAVVNSSLDTSDKDLVSVLDITHGRALLRLSGTTAHDVLAKVCAVDLSDAVTPNGAAFRSSVANLATNVVRDDVRTSGGTERSYLLQCERSSGQYLFDTLLDAGREFDIQVDGFNLDGAITDEPHE
jgi:heterotetrameric sarcosine oxidase gamma subunit